MTNDLTVGKVPRVLISFSLPLLLSTLLQQFYNLADSMIVGWFTGDGGLAAIGAAYPITLFYIAIATGASMGASVVVSELFGARKQREMHTAAYTALISFAVLGVLLAAVGVFGSRFLMTLTNAPADIFDNARRYLAIYAVGAPAMLLYNAATGVFTGMGNSRLPLGLLAFSSVLNVVLDYIAVRFLHLGVAGAAWATTISQVAAAAASVVILVIRLNKDRAGQPRVLYSADVFRRITAAAVPCILQQSCVALSHTIFQSILNRYDTAVIAGYEAASKLHNFVYMSFNTLGTALAAFAAQCCGAGNTRRVREGFKVTWLICLGCAAVVILLFQLFPAQLIGLFIDAAEHPLVIEAGVTYLRIISLLYLPISLIVVTGGLLRGTGQSLHFFIETMVEIAVRIAACYLIAWLVGSYLGLLLAFCIGSVTGGLLCAILAIRTFRRKLRVLPNTEEQRHV